MSGRVVHASRYTSKKKFCVCLLRHKLTRYYTSWYSCCMHMSCICCDSVARDTYVMLHLPQMPRRKKRVVPLAAMVADDAEA